MAASTALMTTVTFIMACMMIPKIYWAWLRSEELFVEGELWRLRLLQAEQNGWVRRHLGYGALVLLLAWLSRNGAIEVPQETTVVLAIYSAVSLAFAVMESVVALRIEIFAGLIPVVPAKLEEERG